MLVNFLKRYSAKIKQLGRKPQDGEDIHAIKQSEIETEESKTKEVSKDNLFTMRMSRFRTHKLECRNLGLERYVDDPETFRNIPRLHHGLERVLKGGLFCENFGISRIYQPEEVDMKRLDLYMLPTKDSRLMQMAKSRKAKFIMSTSTISASMSHLCYILGCFRSPRFDLLSSALDP